MDEFYKSGRGFEALPESCNLTCKTNKTRQLFLHKNSKKELVAFSSKVYLSLPLKSKK